MSTYTELLSRVDLLLGEPHPNNPSPPVRWEVFRGVVQLTHNTALNTAVAWNVRNMDLVVAQNIETYLFAAADFGKDVLVETVDTGDPYQIPRPVSRVSLQSMLLSEFPRVGDDITTDGSLHTARCMAFYRDAGAVYIRVYPIPTHAATYKVWYEVGAPNTDALSNSLFSPVGESYVVSLCALRLLPYCQWAGMDVVESTQKRRELQQFLSADVAVQEKEWKRWLSNDRQSGKVTLTGFGDHELEDWSY